MDERVYARYMSDIAYFQSRLDSAPDSKYYIPVALAYNKLEKYQESIDICRKALEYHPSDDAVKTLLAEAYVYTGHFEFAKELLFDIVTDNDFNYKAFKLLGIVFSSNDELGQALKYYKAAYIRSPEDIQLKQMIEDLGGSSNPDDILQERKTVSQAQTEEEDEENKTYYEIDRHIKNAEMVMADFVADGTITGPKRSPQEIAEEENTITDDEIERLLAGASNKPEHENDDIVIDIPKVKAVEDEDLIKFMAKAHAELDTEASANLPSTDELVALGADETPANDILAALESTEETKPAEPKDELAESLLDILDSSDESPSPSEALPNIDEAELPPPTLFEALAGVEEAPEPAIEAESATADSPLEMPEPLTEQLDIQIEPIAAQEDEVDDEFSESLLAALGDVDETPDVQAEESAEELEDELALSLLNALDSGEEIEDVQDNEPADLIDDELANSLLDVLNDTDDSSDTDDSNDTQADVFLNIEADEPVDISSYAIDIKKDTAPLVNEDEDDPFSGDIMPIENFDENELLSDSPLSDDEEVAKAVIDNKEDTAPLVNEDEDDPFSGDIVPIENFDENELLSDSPHSDDEEVAKAVIGNKEDTAPLVNEDEDDPFSGDIVPIENFDENELLSDSPHSDDEEVAKAVIDNSELPPKVQAPDNVGFKLSVEDLVHDDFESAVEQYEENEYIDVAEAVPFVQSGIFDEIMSASGLEGYGEEQAAEKENSAPVEKTKPETVDKLMKMQSKLMRLKGKAK